MKPKNLDPLFNPQSVAVIGASRDPNSVGYGILKNIQKGCVFENEYCKPFKGRIYAINPNADEILNIKTYPKITDIKEDIDLAIIAVPAEEKYCLERYGEKYQKYLEKTPRWIGIPKN